MRLSNIDLGILPEFQCLVCKTGTIIVHSIQSTLKMRGADFLLNRKCHYNFNTSKT